MIIKGILLIAGLFFCQFFQTVSFKSQQLTYSRVKAAYTEKLDEVSLLLKNKGIELSRAEIFFRVYKQEKALELWARNKNEKQFKFVHTYQVCELSGNLGPKRKQGDFQVPEGFYFIDRYNPSSNYHLSLGIDYPNKSDRKLGNSRALGGDIFIHGSCVTIGCLPMTDDKIKAIYVLAVEAKNNGQKKIPVAIFPFRFGSSNVNKQEMSDVNRSFWNNLKQGHDIIENKKVFPAFEINETGVYVFQ